MSEESQEGKLESAKTEDESLATDAVAVLDGETLPEEQPEVVVDHSKLYVWVADSGNDRIQKFDGNGKFLFSFGIRQ
jgi:DNA-binding beta-propeller fold protein YncE